MSRLLLLPLFLLLLSCSNDDQIEEERNAILKYIADNGYNATETPSGLFYQISRKGNGKTPSLDKRVHVDYKAYLTNNKIVDQSTEGGAIFVLRNLIKGWQEGLPLIEEGGRIFLFCPSRLAYGDRATGSIPANSVLIFEIDLRAVID